MVDPEQWDELRRLSSEVFWSGFHFAIASVTPEGAPHVTPIGSLMLDARPGRAFFFQEFTRQLPLNLEADSRICILGVNSGLAFWLGALLRGKFPRRPAFRLTGRVVGPPRPARSEELGRWRRRLRLLSWTPGYQALWGRLTTVRDVEIDQLLPVHLGTMTR